MRNFALAVALASSLGAAAQQLPAAASQRLSAAPFYCGGPDLGWVPCGRGRMNDTCRSQLEEAQACGARGSSAIAALRRCTGETVPESGGNIANAFAVYDSAQAAVKAAARTCPGLAPTPTAPGGPLDRWHPTGAPASWLPQVRARCGALGPLANELQKSLPGATPAARTSATRELAAARASISRCTQLAGSGQAALAVGRAAMAGQALERARSLLRPQAHPPANRCDQPPVTVVGMPTLDAKGNLDLHEGPTNLIGMNGFGLNQRALGSVRAVMIFVDFPDLHAAPGSEAGVGDHLLGNGQAQEWYRATSHGKMTLTVDRIAGWRRMSKPSTSPDYVFGDFAKQKAFIAEAAGLFGNVDFSRYQIVYVVAANSPHYPASPAYLAHQPADVIHPAHGTIRLGVTFGHDSYTNSFINLVHETNHLLGLPDLYRFIPPEAPPAFRDAGAWDLMSDIFHSKAIVGWHQHKLGWLPATRATLFERGTYKATLSPLGQDCALAMIVVPLDRSLVYVIEQAQTDGTRPEGVLVYLVDAGAKTGHGPIQVRPAATPAQPDRIPAQPFAVGGVFREGNLTVRVLRKIGVLYEVQIDVGASATTRR